MASPAEAAAFAADGYCIVRGLFDSEEVELGLYLIVTKSIQLNCVIPDSLSYSVAFCLK
jgi:hypothetical protein